DEEAVQEDPAVGLSLPGGLVMTMSAAGAGALAGMALERRRDTDPGPDDETEPAQANEPAPDAADTETRAESDEAHLPHTAADEATAKQEPEPATPTGQDLALIDLAQVPGLGITGPGAHSAARTLLTRALDE